MTDKPDKLPSERLKEHRAQKKAKYEPSTPALAKALKESEAQIDSAVTPEDLTTEETVPHSNDLAWESEQDMLKAAKMAKKARKRRTAVKSRSFWVEITIVEQVDDGNGIQSAIVADGHIVHSKEYDLAEESALLNAAIKKAVQSVVRKHTGTMAIYRETGSAPGHRKVL
jgi:hypothetical protein